MGLLSFWLVGGIIILKENRTIPRSFNHDITKSVGTSRVPKDSNNKACNINIIYSRGSPLY